MLATDQTIKERYQKKNEIEEIPEEKLEEIKADSARFNEQD